MQDTAELAVKLMAASARTASKTGNRDFLEIMIITNEKDLKKISETMKAYAPKSNNKSCWLRESSNIEDSQALLLIALKKSEPAGYDCGGCGFETCADFSKSVKIKEKVMGYSGPHCIMNLIDIGSALSSAEKTASMLNVNSKVQHHVGAAARLLGYIKGDIAIGIPVSLSGKSIHFDRKGNVKKIN